MQAVGTRLRPGLRPGLNCVPAFMPCEQCGSPSPLRSSSVVFSSGKFPRPDLSALLEWTSELWTPVAAAAQGGGCRGIWLEGYLQRQPKRIRQLQGHWALVMAAAV